ncbi:MAG: efflux RND transporter periplasmic adaptor subunit [Deltaproteobacteria bacterium]|jgi:RND family efflux transporter MFP subunit|nr:efflux RND transporter periplasmic adaptor subunit [Deltaproteobacteria bacterium]
MAELDTARALVVSAKATVEAASDKLSYTYLKSPYDGVVVEKFVEQYEDVQAKQKIVRVLDTSRIEFTVQVPETLMANVDIVSRAGAYVFFDAYPNFKVPATIKEIGKEASKTTRTYPITLIMDQPEEFKILPGMAGKAKGNDEAASKIAEAEGLEGFLIPVTATFSEDGEKTYVWVVDPTTNTVSKRAVEVITLTENGSLVSGLEQNEVIATAGANMLIEGQQIRVLE